MLCCERGRAAELSQMVGVESAIWVVAAVIGRSLAG